MMLSHYEAKMASPTSLFCERFFTIMASSCFAYNFKVNPYRTKGRGHFDPLGHFLGNSKTSGDFSTKFIYS